jgi:hypothetical protein
MTHRCTSVISMLDPERICSAVFSTRAFPTLRDTLASIVSDIIVANDTQNRTCPNGAGTLLEPKRNPFHGTSCRFSEQLAFPVRLHTVSTLGEGKRRSSSPLPFRLTTTPT